MAKVEFDPSVNKRKGYVLTTHDLLWEETPQGELVRAKSGRGGRPAKVRAICVRWTCGQAYTYSWNPALKREATEGMKRSQGQMKQAVAMAKEIWKDEEQKAQWKARYAKAPGKYKSAWLMLIATCCNNAQCTPEGLVHNAQCKVQRAQWEVKIAVERCRKSELWSALSPYRRRTEEASTTLHVPIKPSKNSRNGGLEMGWRTKAKGAGLRRRTKPVRQCNCRTKIRE